MATFKVIKRVMDAPDCAEDLVLIANQYPDMLYGIGLLIACNNDSKEQIERYIHRRAEEIRLFLIKYPNGRMNPIFKTTRIYKIVKDKYGLTKFITKKTTDDNPNIMF